MHVLVARPSSSNTVAGAPVRGRRMVRPMSRRRWEYGDAVPAVWSGAMDLADRNVVVTGAARGIGAALARRFAAGGARVVVADVGDVAAVVAELPQAIGVTVDISTEQGNVDLIARVRRRSARSICSSPTPASAAAPHPRHARGVLAAVLRCQRQRPPLGGRAPHRRLAGPRRGVLLLDGVGRRSAAADRVGAVHAHQAGGGRLRPVAGRHLRSAAACERAACVRRA